MQFRVETLSSTPDLSAIEQLLAAVDPAVIVDHDARAGLVRVSTCLSKSELVDLMQDAGQIGGYDRIASVPSECCGACG